MLCFVFAALVVLLDQFFKRWIVRMLEVEEVMELIPGVINLTRIHNSGAAFSILANQRWLLAIIAFIASVVIVFILLRYTEGFWGTLGLSAVLGGAVGNLVDRVIHGYVIDMFQVDPGFFKFAIFNIADIFITLGFATFCIHFIVSAFRSAKKDREEAKKVSAAVAGDQDDTYVYPDEFGEPDFDEFSDTKVISSAHSEQRYVAPERYKASPDTKADGEQQASQEQKELSSWREYYEPAQEPSAETVSALEALSVLDTLESELGLGEDYDVDKLLQEYGFEDENN